MVPHSFCTVRLNGNNGPGTKRPGATRCVTAKFVASERERNPKIILLLRKSDLIVAVQNYGHKISRDSEDQPQLNEATRSCTEGYCEICAARPRDPDEPANLGAGTRRGAARASWHLPEDVLEYHALRSRWAPAHAGRSRRHRAKRSAAQQIRAPQRAPQRHGTRALHETCDYFLSSGVS